MDGEVFVFLIFLSKSEKVPRWPDSFEGKESGAGGTNALGGKQDIFYLNFQILLYQVSLNY